MDIKNIRQAGEKIDISSIGLSYGEEPWKEKLCQESVTQDLEAEESQAHETISIVSLITFVLQ